MVYFHILHSLYLEVTTFPCNIKSQIFLANLDEFDRVFSKTLSKLFPFEIDTFSIFRTQLTCNSRWQWPIGRNGVFSENIWAFLRKCCFLYLKYYILLKLVHFPSSGRILHVVPDGSGPLVEMEFSRKLFGRF